MGITAIRNIYCFSFIPLAPCCPSDFNPVFVSSDTVQIVWSPVRGAETYETKAVGWSSELLCNDTATICTLSALQCNTQYNITVYSFSDIRGSNTSCATKHVATGTVLVYTSVNTREQLRTKAVVCKLKRLIAEKANLIICILVMLKPN